METLVVNFMGAPGAGKSTMAARIFSELKWAGYDVELVGEFAKDLVWEERNFTMKDELYLFAKQNHRLFRLNGKVQVIVTDRPIILSQFYNTKYGDKSEAFKHIVKHEYDKYNNMNFFLTRGKAYNPNGRLQTEEESNTFTDEIRDMLNFMQVPYMECDGTEYFVEDIMDVICGWLRED